MAVPLLLASLYGCPVVERHCTNVRIFNIIVRGCPVVERHCTGCKFFERHCTECPVVERHFIGVQLLNVNVQVFSC